MSNEEQLRAKTLALFHSLLSTWANQLRGEVSTIQDGLISQLDSIQARMAKYEENIDEGKILAFVQELGEVSGGGGASRLPQVRASMAHLENGKTLQEVLNTLVQEISQFAPRVALFVIKGGNCIGWNGLGFDQSPGFSNDALKRISVPANADTVFRAVMQSRQRFFGESSAHRIMRICYLGSVRFFPPTSSPCHSSSGTKWGRLFMRTAATHASRSAMSKRSRF